MTRPLFRSCQLHFYTFLSDLIGQLKRPKKIGELSVLKMPSLSAPAGKKENELKAHLDGNKLDLSLMQHDSITPALVRQIGALPKGKMRMIEAAAVSSIIALWMCVVISRKKLFQNFLSQLPRSTSLAIGYKQSHLNFVLYHKSPTSTYQKTRLRNYLRKLDK